MFGGPRDLGYGVVKANSKYQGKHHNRNVLHGHDRLRKWT